MKISIIGQIKNKKTGLGKAVDDFIQYASKSPDVDSLEQIDITDNKLILSHLRNIICSDVDCFYFPPSGSAGGCFRDSLLLLAMLLKRKRIVAHFHNSSFGHVINNNKLLLFINRYIYKRVDNIIILGEKQKQMFSCLNLDKTKFNVIRNGIDNDIFITTNELEKKWSSPVKNVAFFSNMIPDKGYEIVLDVARKLKDNSLYKFYFSGLFFDENLKEVFLSEIKKLPNAIYISGVYGKDKIKFLRSINFFVLPSKYKDETLPISMLEAMASGAYIIISDVGVVSEVLEGNTYHLINIKSQKISDEIIRTILNSNKSIFKFDLDKVRSKFLLENIQKEILTIVAGARLS